MVEVNQVEDDIEVETLEEVTDEEEVVDDIDEIQIEEVEEVDIDEIEVQDEVDIKKKSNNLKLLLFYFYNFKKKW